MYRTGEKPGEGEYYCTFCRKKVTLDHDEDALPVCPRCHHTKFKPVKK